MKAKYSILFLAVALIGCAPISAFLLSFDVSAVEPEVGYCEPFEKGLNIWDIEYGEEYIVVADGFLHFVVNNEGSFKMRAQGSFREISTNAQLNFTGRDIPGGLGLGVILSNGRDMTIDIGPGPNGPGFELSICPDSCSGNYDEYDHPQAGTIRTGSEMMLRIVSTSNAIQFYIDNSLVYEVLEESPIAEAFIYGYGDPGSFFTASADNLCVTYA